MKYTVYEPSSDFPTGSDLVLLNTDPHPGFIDTKKITGKIYIKFSTGDLDVFTGKFENILKQEQEYFNTTGKIKNFFIAIQCEENDLEWNNKYPDVFRLFHVPSLYAWYSTVLDWDRFDPTTRILSKHFTCLNNRMNWYRLGLYRFMLAKQLTDTTYLSCIMSTAIMGGEISDCNVDLPFTEGQDFSEIVKTIPYKNFEEPEIPVYGDWTYGKSELVDTSFCYIITETYNQQPFFTEKTFKCFPNMQPFLLYGGANSLQYLKDLGFKTFGSIFDESYDSEENHITRFEKFTEEIERISKFSLTECKQMLDYVTPILEHNYNHFKYELPKMFDNDMKNVTIEVNKLVEQARKRMTA